MKKVQLISIIIGALILIGFVSSFIYWLQFVKPETEILPKEETANLCVGFPKVEGEINCQEAREVALGKYFGEVKYINKGKVPAREGRPPESQMILEKKVWLFGINLKEPLELEDKIFRSVEVSVDRYTKEISVNKIMNEEISIINPDILPSPEELEKEYENK